MKTLKPTPPMKRKTTLALMAAIYYTAGMAHAAPFLCTTKGETHIEVWPDNPTTAPGKIGRVTLWSDSPSGGKYEYTGQDLDELTFNSYMSIMRPLTVTQRRWTVSIGPSHTTVYDYSIWNATDDRPIATNPAPGLSSWTAPDVPMAIRWGTTANSAEIEGRNESQSYLGWSIRVTETLSLNRTPMGTPGNATLDMPLPTNEYKDITITHTIPQESWVGITHNGEFGPGALQGVRPVPTTGVPLQVVCSRKATQIALKIDTPVIDFGTISHGSTIRYTRQMYWSANGIGQALRWRMRFDNPATQTGAIMLGGGKVTIKDRNGKNVALNTDVKIAAGTSGKYTFELDPTDGQPGAHSTNVLITLTAN